MDDPGWVSLAEFQMETRARTPWLEKQTVNDDDGVDDGRKGEEKYFNVLINRWNPSRVFGRCKSTGRGWTPRNRTTEEDKRPKDGREEPCLRNETNQEFEKEMSPRDFKLQRENEVVNWLAVAAAGNTLLQDEVLIN